MNPTIKIGAMRMAIPLEIMKGITLLSLESINIPNPRKNHKAGSIFCFVL
jgi:hypothetical protein